MGWCYGQQTHRPVHEPQHACPCCARYQSLVETETVRAAKLLSVFSDSIAHADTVTVRSHMDLRLIFRIRLSANSRDLLPLPTPEYKTPAGKQARQAAAKQYRASRDVVESLNPTQQDVLLRLRDYANLVSWSQVTGAAHDETSSKSNDESTPWNSLQDTLSPEALLATSVYSCLCILQHVPVVEWH